MSGSALVILNPTSGRSRATRLWWRLRRALEVPFPHLVIHETTGPGDAGHRAAGWARTGETMAIIVVGGDGTLHEVTNGLVGAGSHGPLGVIPAGTGNDFARNAGIPLDPDLAIEHIAEGRERSLDLGRLRFSAPGGAARNVVFLNSTSVGVSPAANRHAQRLGYVAGGLLALLTEPRRQFTVSERGRVVHQGKALNITIANGAAFGGGMLISPDSSPWDGVLERVIIAPVGLGRALLAFSRLKRGAHIGMAEVSVTKAVEETTIEGDGTLLVEADGHEFLAAGKITVTVEAGAIRVLGAGD